MTLKASQFWLTDLKYVEEKRAMLLNFSQLGFRRMSRQPFFPSFFVKKTFLSSEGLKEILSLERARFKLQNCEKSFKVVAGAFSDLKLLAEALFKATGFMPLVIEPERQFLLEKGWSYFDCFSFFSDKEFVKNETTAFPKARVKFFSEPLPETLKQVIKDSPETAKKTISLIGLSKLLKTKLEAIPSNPFFRQEILLQNALWQAGLSTNKTNPSKLSMEEPLPKMPDLAEADFSKLWAALLTKPFFNLGPDTICCDCCRPKTIFERNILPSSLVSVEMQKDGFFFESCSKLFASSFHKSHKDKESRLRRKKEFFLKSIPVGPFFRNQKALVPLADAFRLREEGKAKIVSLKEAAWFCLKKESLVSKAVFELNSVSNFAEKELDKVSLESVKQHKVLSLNALSYNLEYLLLESVSESASRLVSSLFKQLSSEKSGFYTESLCSAIQAIQYSVLDHFHSFAAEKKSNVILKENKVFLSSQKPNSLVKQFSQKQAILLKTTKKPN